MEWTIAVSVLRETTTIFLDRSLLSQIPYQSPARASETQVLSVPLEAHFRQFASRNLSKSTIPCSDSQSIDKG